MIFEGDKKWTPKHNTGKDLTELAGRKQQGAAAAAAATTVIPFQCCQAVLCHSE